jgi:UDPglucose 6-dehydrogenase
MKIVVAGFGPVGKSIYAALNENPFVDVYIDDPFLDRNYPFDMASNVDGVVVAVSTPMAKDGFCDTSNIDDVLDKYPDSKILVKSTTDPTFFAKYKHRDITFSPEFLRGSTGADPVQEFLNSEFAIYGGGSMRWWHEILKPGLPRLKNVKFCSLEQAAFAKYVVNAFLATKVTFFNQMYKIYESLGFEDFDVMIDAVSVDPRIGMSHTQVPGPDGSFGFGGHCFPKDVNAITNAGDKAGADVEFLKSVLEANDRYRNVK